MSNMEQRETSLFHVTEESNLMQFAVAEVEIPLGADFTRQSVLHSEIISAD